MSDAAYIPRINRLDVALCSGRLADFKKAGEKHVAALGKMVRGLADRNDAIFNEGLLELLFVHRRNIRQGDGPQRFFSLAGVGLSILAVRRGLLKQSDLPRNDHLPLELIS